MHKQIFLENNEIYLRPLSDEDLLSEYPTWFNDEEICKHNGHFRFPYTLIEAKNYLVSLAGNKSIIVLAIISKETGEHVGNISLQNISFIDRCAELAIIIGNKKYHGKGFGKMAAHALVKHGFYSLNLHRIYCGTSDQNIGMQKVALSLGMREEGRRRSALFKNGKYYDILEYGLLAEDFIMPLETGLK